MSEISHFRGYDFTGTDWSDSNRAIAARIGADESLVAAARRYFGMVIKVRVDWSQDIDWGLDNKTLAKMYGVHESTVSRQRAIAGYGFGGIDWSEADWSKPDTQIAAELGCSAMAVGKARRRITGEAGRGRGRPKKEASERHVVKVSLSTEEYAGLCTWAENAGTTPEGAAARIVANAVRGERDED